MGNSVSVSFLLFCSVGFCCVFGFLRKRANELDSYYHSSSCAVRSAVSCYNVANKFTFDPKYFVEGKNEIVLSLPPNATDYESAVLPRSVYVQYDALRLEVV